MKNKFLRELGPDEVKEEHWARITSALRKDFFGTKLENVVEMLNKGLLRFWHLTAQDVDVLILWSVQVWPRGREFFVWLVEGKGFFKNFDEVLKLFETLAKAEQCDWIGCYALGRSAPRFYQRFGGHPARTHYVKELTHGRRSNDNTVIDSLGTIH